MRTRRPSGLSLPKYFRANPGAHNRDRLFRIVIVDREIAALQNFQSDRRKVTVGNELKVALRPVAIGDVSLAIDFVLAEAAEGHAETAGESGAFESRIAAQSAATRERKIVRALPRSDNRLPLIPCARSKLRSRRSRNSAWFGFESI